MISNKTQSAITKNTIVFGWCTIVSTPKVSRISKANTSSVPEIASDSSLNIKMIVNEIFVKINTLVLHGVLNATSEIKNVQKSVQIYTDSYFYVVNMRDSER